MWEKGGKKDSSLSIWEDLEEGEPPTCILAIVISRAGKGRNDTKKKNYHFVTLLPKIC